jgi:hypothetical protein
VTKKVVSVFVPFFVRRFNKDKVLEYCKRFRKHIMETLNIEFVDAGEGF